MNKLDRIFCNPVFSKDEYVARYGEGYSNLYLLRKDIWWCRGLDSRTKRRIEDNAGAPFAAFILIRVLFNYIVYLANTDYQSYIKKYFPITLNIKELEVLNRLRNALEHQSYRLEWNPDKNKKEKGKTTFFAMTEERTSPLVGKIDEREDDETWIVNIHILHKAIEDSIEKLRNSIEKNHLLLQEILIRSENHDMHVVSKEDFIKYSTAKKRKLRTDRK